MSIEERIDRLTGIVEALATTVVAHDNQIQSLIALGEKHQARLDQLTERVKELTQSTATLERQWKAYLNTLPRN